MKNSIGLLGAAFGWGQKLPGLVEAPDFFRYSGLIELIAQHGYDVKDYGNVYETTLSTSALSDPRFGAGYQKISDLTHRISRNKKMTLTLGGDHSIALGTIHGLLQTHPNLGIIWVDAHGDINTPTTSLSGHFHGMPVAGLLGRISQWAGFEWLKHTLNPAKIVYVGVRDLDHAEQELIGSLGIRTFTMNDVREMGICTVMREAIRWVSYDGKCPLHLSFDIDSVDPKYAANTGVPVANGLTPLEIKLIAQSLAHTERLVATDIVEFNPLLAQSDLALKNSWGVIETLIENLLPPVTHNSSIYRLHTKTNNIFVPSSRSPVTSCT